MIRTALILLALTSPSIAEEPVCYSIAVASEKIKQSGGVPIQIIAIPNVRDPLLVYLSADGISVYASPIVNGCVQPVYSVLGFFGEPQPRLEPGTPS